MPIDNTYAHKYWWLFEITRLMMYYETLYRKTGSFAERKKAYYYRKKLENYIIEEVKKRKLNPELF